jgi:integrase
MSIFQPENSPYWYYDLTDRRGKRVKRSTGTKDKVQAQEFHDAEYNRLWTLNKLGDSGAHTFAEAAERWLNETDKRSVDKDRQILAWFCGEIGSDQLSSLNVEGINKLRTLCATVEAPDGEDLPKGRKGKRSKQTVNRYMDVLNAVLHKAGGEWEWLKTKLPTVPMYKFKKNSKKEPRFLTPEEFERLRQQLPQHLALAAEFAVETGLRMRSQLGLTWDRVDLKAQHAWVPSISMKGDGTFGFTLSPGAMDVLRRCKAAYPTGDHVFQYEDAKARILTEMDIRRTVRDLKRSEERVSFLRLYDELLARFGSRGNSGRVRAIWRKECGASRAGLLCRPKWTPQPKAPLAVQRVCRPFDDGNTDAFKAAVVRAGLDPKVVHWHTFRHTFASWAVQAGVPLVELMAMGDWADYRSVFVYAYLDPKKHLAKSAALVSEKRLTHRAA